LLPLLPLGQAIPRGFLRGFPVAMLVILLPPLGIRRRHSDVYLSGVKVNRETCAGKLISIVDGLRVIYHDSLRAERREGEYTRIDMKLATVACTIAS